VNYERGCQEDVDLVVVYALKETDVQFENRICQYERDLDHYNTLQKKYADEIEIEIKKQKENQKQKEKQRLEAEKRKIEKQLKKLS